MGHPVIRASVRLWADSEPWATQKLSKITDGLETMPTAPSPEAEQTLTDLARDISAVYEAVAPGADGNELAAWYLSSAHAVADRVEQLCPEAGPFNRPRWSLTPEARDPERVAKRAYLVAKRAGRCG